MCLINERLVPVETARKSRLWSEMTRSIVSQPDNHGHVTCGSVFSDDLQVSKSRHLSPSSLHNRNYRVIVRRDVVGDNPLRRRYIRPNKHEKKLLLSLRQRSMAMASSPVILFSRYWLYLSDVPSWMIMTQWQWWWWSLLESPRGYFIQRCSLMTTDIFSINYYYSAILVLKHSPSTELAPLLIYLFFCLPSSFSFGPRRRVDGRRLIANTRRGSCRRLSVWECFVITIRAATEKQAD